MVLALLAAVLTVVTLPAGTAAAADRPLASTPLITWNMRGANEREPDTNKWQNHVRNYARQAPIVMLQEAGPTPARSTTRLDDLTRITTDSTNTTHTHTIQHHRWNVGSDSRVNYRDVYFVLTQNGEGGRVNLAMVVDGQPDEVNVVQNPVEAGRVALGVRYGANWYFTVHGLSGGGRDSAVLLDAIDSAVERWGQDRRVEYRWTVGGDFNLDPDTLRNNNRFPPARTLNTPPNVPTHDSGGRLDYFVTDDFVADVGPSYIYEVAPSDHRVVGLGRLRAAAEKPPSTIKLMPLGDDLILGTGSSNESGARDEIQEGLGKLTVGFMLGNLDGTLLYPSIDKRDLVGSQRNGRGIPDTDHMGYANHSISQIRQQVLVPPPPARPNVVALLAGTNDMVRNEDVGNAPDRLNQLIDRVFAIAPDTVIVLGTLPPSTDVAVQSRIEDYNDSVRRLVDDRTGKGDHLVLVELSAVTTDDLVDSIHPGDEGYNKIGEAYVAGVRSALLDGWIKEPSGDSGPPANQDPLPPPTVGRTDIRRADPSVIRVDSTYYSVESGGDGSIYTRSASSPAGLSNSQPRRIWTDPGMGEIWAPELTRIDGRYYVYFSAGRGPDHRMYVISSASPADGYGTHQELALPGGRWAIDGSAFTFDNQLWFVWSGWEGDEDVEQNLYIARMSSPTTPTGARHLISQPRESWERVTGRINEAPEAIKDPNGQLHIVYSANGSWTDQYCLADLRLRKGGDPTYVWDWYKSNGCLFGSNRDTMMSGWEPTQNVNGPGHHSFVLLDGDINTSPPAGSKFPLMYHGVPKGMQYKWENRVWYGGAFTWWNDITYGRSNVPGDNRNSGYSLGFFEDANAPLPSPPVPGPPGQGLIKNADPSVMRVGSTYYSVESDGNNIYSRSASSPAGLSKTPRTLIWSSPKNMPNVWAPEIVKLKDHGNVYAVYFASGDGKGGQRMYYTWSASPDRGFSDPVPLKLPDNRWAVDGTAFYFDNQLWFVWSGWEGESNVEQNLYIARMSSPSDVTGKRYIISQPREEWEKKVGLINEAPQPIKDPNGQLHIVYSANGSWSDQYCMADLRLRAGGDPTHVWDWYKSNGCLFGSNRDTMMEGWDPTLYVNGPGSHSFVLLDGDINTSPPAGPTFPLMFHAVPKGTPYSWDNRMWHTGTFTWWGDVTYSRKNVPGDNTNRGWSLKFFE